MVVVSWERQRKCVCTRSTYVCDVCTCMFRGQRETLTKINLGGGKTVNRLVSISHGSFDVKIRTGLY